jgi:hypothetical protein
MLTMVCSMCNQEKDISLFCKVTSPKNRNKSRCRKCLKESFDKYRTKEYYRRSNLKKNYGISVEEYNQLLISQGGKCKICESPNPKSKRYENFCVDHDHRTGKIRGLLCTSCNRMIGLVHDDIESLERAIRYLASFKIMNEVIAEAK